MNLNLSRRAFAAGTALLPIACTQGTSAMRAPAVGKGATLPEAANPLVKNRADAQIFLHEDGYYYMTGSVPEYDRLVLRRARTIAGLATAEERILWRHEESGPLSGFIWAPEMHRVDGRWYVYFAAGPSGGGEDVFRIRTYAVECDGPDPMTGNWSVLGEFKAPWDSFNLDSKAFTHRGTRYFTWAQREPGIETNSNLYIAKLTGPLTVGPATRLSVPTYDWEIRGFKVNEGAAVIENAGRLFMTYSASATDDRYCLGLLSIDAEGDLLDADAWTKSPTPVFQTSVATSVYGPGHNDFTVDEQGRPILVYHGRDYKEIEGDPLFNPDRHTRVQRVYFSPDGTPDFGIPVGNGRVPERFVSAAERGAFLACEGPRIMAGSAPLAQTQIRSIDAGDGAFMLSPILQRGMCIRAAVEGTLALAAQDGDDAHNLFQRRPGAITGTVQLESVATPGKALGIVGDRVALVPLSDPSATWQVD